MVTDIVIRSWVNDFAWLVFCLKSIQRFATGFRRIIVIVPHGHTPPTGACEFVFYVTEQGEGYMEQQSTKLHADAFSDADFFLFMDSDTIFTRPICPEDMIVGDKVRWLYTPYASINSGDGQTWKEPTGKVMCRPVEFEFMRRHPLVAPRWALEGLRHWMLKVHGMSLERYIMAQQAGRAFSEWNCLGAWLWFYHHDRVIWQNTDEELGESFVLQSFSWNGLNDKIRYTLDKALA